MRRILSTHARAVLLGAGVGLAVAGGTIGLWAWLYTPSTTYTTLPSAVVKTPPAPVALQPAPLPDQTATLRTTAAPPPRYIAHAAPVQVLPHRALVAIVLDDMGVNVPLSAQALTLPPPLTLSFLPYGEASLALAKKAKKQGHDIMVHLPMEPAAHLEEPAANPGPNALYVADDLNSIITKTQKNLRDYLPLAVGVNNHMGSRFTSDKNSMMQVLPLIEAAGLFYLDSLTTPHSQVRAAAQALNLTVPLLQRDVFLDHVIGRPEVDAALQKLEQEAHHQGFAIAIGHPHSVTIQALQQWLPTLEAKGLQLVPLSYIAQQKRPLLP